MTHDPDSLNELERRVARDLHLLNYPPENWVPERLRPDGKPMLDVLIVGGGMCGLVAAFALRRLGISNIRMIDAAPKGLEGPWVTMARMNTLRSPKHLTGPAAGMAGLTFQAWFEAGNGPEAWSALGRIPRLMWVDYLAWYARVIDAPVESETRLLRISEGRDSVTAHIVGAESKPAQIVSARHLVMATGREGLAAPRIPPAFKAHIGSHVFHTGHAPDRARFKDRHVVVIGVAASAFDYAAEALEAGARQVTMLSRRADLSRINKAKQITFPGVFHGFPQLPDVDKFAIFSEVTSYAIVPPRSSLLRVTQHDNADIRMGSEVLQADLVGDELHLETNTGKLIADIVVLGTGFRIGVDADAVLLEHADHIKTWRDALSDQDSRSELLEFPYLGAGFEFEPRAGDALQTLLSRTHCFNHAAMVSLGNLANDIPAVSEGADRLSQAIASSLFVEDREAHIADLKAYEEPELDGDEAPTVTGWYPALD